jgi:2-dehydropantoate 2-reductase
MDSVQPIRTVSILGAGAIGATYAALLYDADPTCVTLVAGGERYDRLTRQGLVVNGVLYHIPVLRPEDAAPPADLVLVALKHPHLAQGVRDLRCRVGEGTAILSAMNGLDSEAILGAAYGTDKVLYAVSVGIDAVRTGNRVTYSKQGRLLFGEAEKTALSERVRRVCTFFDRVGLSYDTPPDMLRVLWWKWMINVGVNQASAVLRAPYGLFQASEDARALMDAAMREAIALARAAEVDLGEQDIADWHAILATLAPQGKTSMLQDVEAGRKTEVEIFGGKAVELGRAYGIPTPVNETLLRLIRVLEQRGSEDG